MKNKICPLCGTTTAAPAAATEVRCPRCAAVIRVGGAVIEVSGRDANEVRDVATALATQEDARRAAARLSGPWSSGLFYLLAAVVLVGVVLAVATVLPLWALPVVIVGAVALLAVTGALQLRQDDRLGEKGFLELMRLSLAQLKLFGRKTPAPPQ